VTGQNRDESQGLRRRRVHFRAWRRGFRELDLILGQFADRYLDGLTAAELGDFEALLEAPDGDVYQWITGGAALPEVYRTPLMVRLQKLDYLSITS
jgi:antitoxin CptB